MVLKMIKGQKIDLTKNNPDLNLLHIGLDWSGNGSFDIDVSAFMLGQDEKITREEDFVFYGQPSSSNGAVTLEESISSNEKHHFIIDLIKVPQEVQKIALTLSIYESELNGHTFEEVSSVQLRILNSRNQDEIAYYMMEDYFNNINVIVLGNLYRYAGEWKFQAVGAGFFGGLAALCNEYGIEVEDQTLEENQNQLQTNVSEELPNQGFAVVKESKGVDSDESQTSPVEMIPPNHHTSNQMMKDYIAIPDIVSDVKEIHSENLVSLFENSTINEDTISLDFLREKYKMDRTRFINMVDELSVRGFRFITEKPTNILPNNVPQLSSYIQVKEEDTRFKNIDLSGLGIGGFIQRFHVTNDLFFHKIPLNGFKFLNASIELNNVEKEFLSAGFEIINMEDPKDLSTENGVVKEEEGSYVTDTSTDYCEELISTITIHQLFEDNKYKLFRNFCERKKLTFISEITPDVLDKYRRTPSVGSGKVHAVEERLEEVKRLGVAILPDEAPDPDEPVVQLKNKYAGEKKIPELFYENGFNKFRLFCEEMGIETVGQIKKKHIDLFTRRPTIGRKKVQDVLELLENYAINAEKDIPSIFETGDLFNSIKQWQVSSLLKFFGYQTISNSSQKIEEIQGENYEVLEGEFDVRTLIEFSNKLRSLKFPKTIADEIQLVLNERDRAVIHYRFKEKWTLEETGQSIGVTRERVRQIEDKALRKLFRYLEVNNFHLVVKLLTTSNSLVTNKELLGLIGEENSYLIEVFKGKNSFFVYFDKLDVFCCDPEECKDFNEMEEFIFELPDYFYFNEIEQLFEEILDKVGVKETSIDMIHQVLEGYGFNRYGELYSKRKLTVSDILERLFQKYILKPLRIDEEGLKFLQKLAFEQFDYMLEGSVRSVDARLRDLNNLLLVDSNTYQWFDSENFDQAIVTRIDHYLKHRFEEVNVINIEEVFKAFEEQLKPYEIFNKLHLYSIIRFYLDDEYSIGKGNTLNIYQNEEDKMNRKETIVEAIRKMGGTCSKDYLQEMLRVPMYRIDQAISSSENMIPWGTNQVIIFEEIGLTAEEIEGLLALVNRSIKDGYTTIGIIHRELMFDRNLAGLISKKGIDTKQKLAAVIKNIKSGLKGHTNFLYEEGCSFTSFEDVILTHFKEGATRRDVQEFAVEHGYAEVMAAHILNGLLEREELVEVDLNVLYPANLFEIPDEVVQALTSFIEQHMMGKDYISLSNLKGYRRKLPVLEFRWNPYLMRSILVRNGYRQINKIYRDYRYDKVLLVKEESKITSFEELVFYAIKEEYEGNLHEVKVYDFLVEKGILREQEYDHEKVLPFEIKEKNTLITVDDIGIVMLRQGN